MLSDEAFGNLLTDTKRALTEWADRYETAAEIIIEEDSGFWRIQSLPSEPALCPVELLLRPDRNYDLVVMDASVEDQPIEQFEFFIELFEAVAAGLPIVRTYTTHATQQLLGTTTVVPLENGTEWRVESRTTLGERFGSANALVVERRFAAYAVR